ncbi:MAG: hypothetical protein ACXWC9_01300 [Pseudobdellovibrionaceae bacterium]
MDRLLIAWLLSLISFSVQAGTREQIKIDLDQMERAQESIYQKLKASMGESIPQPQKTPRKIRLVSSEPADYKVRLVSSKPRVAKSQGR